MISTSFLVVLRKSFDLKSFMIRSESKGRTRLGAKATTVSRAERVVWIN